MHEKYMRLAIAIARRSQAAPFGAILIHRRTGEVVAEGLNRWKENPTWHGEIDAINRFAAARCAEAPTAKQWGLLVTMAVVAARIVVGTNRLPELGRNVRHPTVEYLQLDD